MDVIKSHLNNKTVTITAIIAGFLLAVLFTISIPSTSTANMDECERDVCTDGVLCTDSGTDRKKCDMVALDECKTLNC
jgi:hypothetical protein